MLLNRIVGIVAVTWWLTAPSLLGQDFLKQLEDKILKRQEDSKTKQETPPPESPVAGLESSESLPSPRPPSPPPMLLGPASKGADEDLPAPKRLPETKSADPSSTRTTTKPPATTKPPTTKRVPATPAKPLSAGANGFSAGGGYLGMTVESMPGGGFGLEVVDVKRDSPAWKAGFRIGDRLIGVEGNAVSTVDAFAEQLAMYGPGSPVKFLVERLGKSSSITAVLMDRNVANRIHGNVPGTQSSLKTSEQSGQGYFGINVSDMSDAYRRQFAIPVFRGASVTEVIDGSPAEQAGLKPGDCIVSFANREVRNAEDVLNAVLSSVPGQAIAISFYRGTILNHANAILVRADSELRGQDMPGPLNSNLGITRDMLTPEYVSSLHQELERTNNELQSTQQKLQQLEARLRQLENRR